MDGWNLPDSHAIHFGYRDDTTRTFAQTLLRMNDVLANWVQLKSSDHLLDAGCGSGGSCIYLSGKIGCKSTGITLVEREVARARELAAQHGLCDKVRFECKSYLDNGYDDASFDVVWGLESICYAEDKRRFVKEAFRLLKTGGRLIIAEGMVTDFENNTNSMVRSWLSGWRINYLESPENYMRFFHDIGFVNVSYRNITPNVMNSSRRLFGLFFASRARELWKKLQRAYTGSRPQEENINAGKFQYYGLKEGLWQYGVLVGQKPG